MSALVFGLREDSRIKMKLADKRYTSNQILMARMIDELSFISWTKTDDAAHGRNRPESLLAKMVEKPKEKENETYASPEEFLRAWKNLTERENTNG